ncbi:DUF4870 domain-containing protein [Streptomonospora nanhaiensis]|uniref:DUF4870 domain-containing protein n=1 Tax=Streptomonospora nanhaiensis TaxID=1323731 RepID=UPI001C38B357|nr:DUF4870 domain-containing protein [Streptomonospora nanhaiensis]MBV2363064.1 DUF4870 domain-containing protein [Streptomonospora nanhaiensis]MBX9388920.1 DUF4870 domain-containing protein [Streptomonospora nanhaiensis]
MSYPPQPNPPYDGQGGGHQNYPGGYGPPPGVDPNYGYQSGPQQGYGAGHQQGYGPGAQGGYGRHLPAPMGQYGPVSSEDRTMALVAHLGGVFTGFLLPLVLYFVKKDESAFVRHHSAQAFNFQMTMFIGVVVSCVLMFVIIGFVTIFIIPILVIVFGIIAAMKANQGEWYKYPMTIPMLK